jgi:hypothetical protein
MSLTMTSDKARLGAELFSHAAVEALVRLGEDEKTGSLTLVRRRAEPMAAPIGRAKPYEWKPSHEHTSLLFESPPSHFHASHALSRGRLI